jgi:hypothetical protein
VAKKSPALLKARDEVVKPYHGALMKGAGVRGRLSGGETWGSGLDPANMVWIFCTSRRGSTWLRSMMAEIEGHKVWEELSVGRIFGNFYRKGTPGAWRENLTPEQAQIVEDITAPLLKEFHP